jgi:hypothetical protein
VANAERKTIVIDVAPTTTIRRVKTKIQEKWAIPCYHQRLVFGSSETESSKSLWDYNIGPNAILVLLLRIAGARR